MNDNNVTLVQQWNGLNNKKIICIGTGPAMDPALCNVIYLSLLLFGNEAFGAVVLKFLLTLLYKTAALFVDRQT